jgi:hypothetical protein
MSYATILPSPEINHGHLLSEGSDWSFSQRGSVLLAIVGAAEPIRLARHAGHADRSHRKRHHPDYGRGLYPANVAQPGNEDTVHHAVGMVLHKKTGDRVTKGEALCTIHCSSEEKLQRVRKLIEESYEIADGPPAQKKPLVHRIVADL